MFSQPVQQPPVIAPQIPQQQPQQQIEQPVQASVLQPSQNGDCSTVSIEQSVIPSANGVYRQISADLYKRADDTLLPGILASLDSQHWCLSLSFDNVDRLTIEQVRQQCGANFECCMLVGTGSSNDLVNRQRVWSVNTVQNRGDIDGEIRLTCVNSQEGIIKNNKKKSLFF